MSIRVILIVCAALLVVGWFMVVYFYRRQIMKIFASPSSSSAYTVDAQARPPGSVEGVVIAVHTAAGPSPGVPEMKGADCPVCYHPFTTKGGGGRMPKVFPCGHTACEACVGQMSRRGGGSVPCPLCRREAPPSEVKTNFALCDVLQAAALNMDATRGELLAYEAVSAACGRWAERQIIGRGGSATVYQAELPRFGQCAVKRFLPAGEGVSSIRDFTRELEALCQCRHPHILEIIGHAHEGPENLIVMPLMEGGTLFKSLPQMNWMLRAVILGQVVRALSFLHAKSMLHRDVKSTNILLDRSLRHSRLADFGLAKEKGPNAHVQGTTAVVVGSPGYMAPELMMRPASEKTDAFALGAVFLEVLTGLPAWGGANGEGVSIVDRAIQDGAFVKTFLDAIAQWPPDEANVVSDRAVELTCFDPSRRSTVISVEQGAEFRAHLERAEAPLISGATPAPAVLGNQC